MVCRQFSRMFVASSLAVVAGLVSLHAKAQVHAPSAPFTATLNSSGSTIFNTTQGFNGGRADFGGSWGYTNPMGGSVTTSGVQSFSATFDADPGSVFTNVSLGFEGWSYSNPENSSVAFYMNWNVSAGSDSWSGTYTFTLGGPQGGGGGLGLPIPGSAIALGNVATFSVDFEASIWAWGLGYFGDGTGAGLGFSQFGVNTVTAAGNPVTTPIPEPEIYAMMGLGLGLLGWMGRRRRLQAL